MVLISSREVLAEAIQSLLHLAVGKAWPLVRFSSFEDALEDKRKLESAELLLVEGTTELK